MYFLRLYGLFFNCLRVIFIQFKKQTFFATDNIFMHFDTMEKAFFEGDRGEILINSKIKLSYMDLYFI